MNNTKQTGDSRPIGVFDSGVGGLTVLREIRRLMPQESIIYVGDTARVPYGAKSPEQLLQYGQEIIRFLLNHKAKAVVLACGTSSSNSYEQLQSDFPNLPLIDVIRPGVSTCFKLASNNSNDSACKPFRLGFIGTEATVRSGLFKRLLTEQMPLINNQSQQIDLKFTKACPLFAPMVEAGYTNNSVAQWVADTYLSDWKGRIDALVMGCTHYPLLSNILKETLGPIHLINLGTSAAQLTQLTLTNTLSLSNIPPTYQFFVSGHPDSFSRMARYILEEDCYVQKIERF